VRAVVTAGDPPAVGPRVRGSAAMAADRAAADRRLQESAWPSSMASPPRCRCRTMTVLSDVVYPRDPRDRRGPAPIR